MKINLGVSVYSIPGQDIDKLLEFALNNQFGAIELWDLPLPDKPTGRYEDLEEHYMNISVHAPLIDIGDTDSVEVNITSLTESIKRANRWKANKLVLHTGMHHNKDRDTAMATAREVINKCIPALEESSINLCIENVGYLGNDLINDFVQLKQFIINFPEELIGVAFDVSHANIVGGVSKGIDILGRRINHIHLSDNTGDIRNHHLPIGKGNIDFKALTNLPTSGTSILEITPNEYWEKNLLDSRRFLQNLGIDNWISESRG